MVHLVREGAELAELGAGGRGGLGPGAADVVEHVREGAVVAALLRVRDSLPERVQEAIELVGDGAVELERSNFVLEHVHVAELLEGSDPLDDRTPDLDGDDVDAVALDQGTATTHTGPLGDLVGGDLVGGAPENGVLEDDLEELPGGVLVRILAAVGAARVPDLEVETSDGLPSWGVPHGQQELEDHGVTGEIVDVLLDVAHEHSFFVYRHQTQ